MFGFVAKHRGVWPVSWMCDALGVSRSGFHAYLGLRRQFGRCATADPDRLRHLHRFCGVEFLSIVLLLWRRGGDLMLDPDTIPGFVIPVHRALTEPILLAGAPRAIAILNGTLAAAIGLGLQLWLVGLLIWIAGHLAAVWAAKRDPLFVDVVRRHLRIPGHLGV